MARRKKKKRSTITRDEAVRRMEGMIPHISRNVRFALRAEAALESANEIVMSDYREKRTYGVGCYNTVKDCMELSLALALARLYDLGIRSQRPNRRDTASIPLLVLLLKQKRCRGVLVARARAWKPQDPGMAEVDAKCCERAIDNAINAFSALRRIHNGRQGLTALKRLRDKRLAHSDMSAVLKALPRYEQLHLLMDVARDFTAHARLAIEGHHHDLESFEEERRRESDTFWEPALQAAFAGHERWIRPRRSRDRQETVKPGAEARHGAAGGV